MTEASARGKSNRRKGAEAERKVCAWLRLNGFPHAERAIRTGFTVADRTVADAGDITGTPGLVWQVKAVARRALPTWLRETRAQLDAARADYGVLVHKAKGVVNPAEWPAWLLHRDGEVQDTGSLAVVVTALREKQYGQAIEEGA